MVIDGLFMCSQELAFSPYADHCGPLHNFFSALSSIFLLMLSFHLHLDNR
jgi:hypothetical protein